MSLLTDLRARFPNVPIEALYHPDAYPGDGSGWAVTVADRTTYGQLDDAIRQHLEDPKP